MGKKEWNLFFLLSTKNINKEQELKLKLSQIAECIIEGVTNNFIENTDGAYDGKFGVLLFLYYYSKYTNDEEIRLFSDRYAERLLENLDVKITSATFCSGLFGILYLLEHLKEHSFIDVDFEDIKLELNDYLKQSLNIYLSQNKYDFMHGALGIGLYFVKVKEETDSVLKLIDYLYDSADKDFDNNIFKWKSVLNPEGDIGYNIALSHGMSSIVIFLSRAIRASVEHENLHLLLNGAVNYIKKSLSLSH